MARRSGRPNWVRSEPEEAERPYTSVRVVWAAMAMLAMAFVAMALIVAQVAR